MNNNSPRNPRITVGMASGRKLPEDFHARPLPRGPLGGLQPLQMIDTNELENRWKEPLGKQPTNNIMRDARLSQ